MAKVVVIGSEGRLGSALVEAPAGHDVRRVDAAAPAEPGAQRGDVRICEDMNRAVAGADAVVHLVAWHGGYHPAPSNETRFDVNVVGTFRVLQACLKHDVRKVVWASSVAVRSPGSFYGTTKILGEDLCRHYHLAHGFDVAMMRYGAFTPCDLVTYGLRLLEGGVDRRDCVEATLAALDAVIEGRARLSACTVLASHPFTDEERERFGADASAIVSRYWPGFEDLLERYRLKFPEKLQRPDTGAAEGDRAWECRYNFGTFLEELRRKDDRGLIRSESPRWRFESGTEPPEGIVWPDQ